MAETIYLIMTKEVELHNQGQTSCFHFGVVYPLPADAARYLIRIGAALPFKNYAPKNYNG